MSSRRLTVSSGGLETNSVAATALPGGGDVGAVNIVVPGNQFVSWAGTANVWTADSTNSFLYAFYPITAYGTQVPTGNWPQVTMSDSTFNASTGQFTPASVNNAASCWIVATAATNLPGTALGSLASAYAVCVAVSGATPPLATNLFNIYIPKP
jgi:hypothetical protein